MTAKTTLGRTAALCLLSCLAILTMAAPASAALPSTITGAASAVTSVSATISGTVNTDSTPVDCHFDYVPVAQYRVDKFASLTPAQQVPCDQALGSIPLNTTTTVTATVTRPSPDPTLVYRLVTSNASGSAAGVSQGIGFGVAAFDGGTYTGIDAGFLRPIGAPVTQAGAHPTTATTDFSLTTIPDPTPSLGDYGTEELKDVVVDLPAGLIGNPEAVSAVCTADQLSQANDNACPVGSQVGYITAHFHNSGAPGNPRLSVAPLFKQPAPTGTAALFGFQVQGAVFHLLAKLRRDPGAPGAYRVRIVSLNTPQALPLSGAGATVWGVPSDPSLDFVRGTNGGTSSGYTAPDGRLISGQACVYAVPGTPSAYFSNCQNVVEGHPVGHPSPAYPDNVKPFFTLPTSCEGPVATDVYLNSWQGSSASTSFLSHDLTPTPVGNTGCNTLDFSPTLEARPTTNIADSPSGLDVDLHVPQDESCTTTPTVNCATAEAHLKDTTVVLPKGLVINPSSANGLDACSPAQVDLEGQDPANCPDASKVASVQVDTPLLDHPVEGAAYIATPHNNNPFNSLLALYIALNDPQSGTVVKVAGEVQPDPVTGQLTATFEENPQVPFEDFKLHFKGGSHGTLRTPATCGQYSTTSSLTPWSAPDSGPPATPQDTWSIEQGPGGNCASDQSQLPNSPSFDAGTVSPIAGAKTPLVVNLRRNDGTQQFHSVTLSPPQGLVGKLAGIPYCSQASLDEAAAKSGRAEEASPSCPQASYVGSVTAAAGAGPAPYYAPGKAYLTGPYKGAPLSIAIVTPATAGPFDLGTIVVKTALYVDRTTAQITAVSDPIPSILQGIPLDVRSVQVKMDRPDFTINPTSCDPSSFGGQLMSTLGQTAPLQSRFQVGECGRLAFKPQLTLALRGGTKRTGHPALTATMTMPEGGANLAAISVALPHSEFLDQSHIGTICTRVQFKADQCPAASIYGTVQVDTPLLDYPLTGNVYLRSSDNPLPDLVPDLRGPAFQPIALEADGRVDSVKGGIRNTFDFVPDAPFSKLTLSMQGGKKGLLENSTNLCRKVQRATVNYTAHNGATLTAKPALKVKCSKAKKHKKAKRAKRGARHR